MLKAAQLSTAQEQQLSWGDRLPYLSLAPCVVVMDSHALVWPLEAGGNASKM